MKTNSSDKKELFRWLDNAGQELLQLISSCDENKINHIPFKNSWTAAQVAAHVTASNTYIVKALKLQGKLTQRNPAERAGELKDIFLNFTTKLKSPEFILPAKEVYKKVTLLEELKKSTDDLIEEGNRVDLAEAINHPSFGDITKLELLYFVVYHTQRHIHQLKNIFRFVD